MSGLHRDNNASHDFLPSRRLQKPREEDGGRKGPGPGEVLTDIRALADQFLIAFPNINSRDM